MKIFQKNMDESQIRNYKKLIEENEAEASIVFGKLLLAVSAAFVLEGTLNLFGVLSTYNTSVYASAFLSGAVLAVLAVSALRNKQETPKSWLKYTSLIVLLFSILFINIAVGYKYNLLYAVPAILSIRFYNKRFTATAVLLSMAMILLSALANAYLTPYTRFFDLNMVSFSEPGTLEYTGWLHNAVLSHGYDPGLIFSNGLRLSVLPHCLILLLILISSNSVINNALRILIRAEEQHEREMQMRINATMDSMTGLWNRRAYHEDFDKQTEEIPKDFVYVLFDVNGLKKINDTLGHTAGDELIRGAAACMKETFAPYGRVYRWGGDEFAALIYADEEQLNRVKKEFADIVSSWHGNEAKSLSVATGYVTAAEMTTPFTMQDMADLADKRMYEVKKAYHAGEIKNKEETNSDKELDGEQPE